MFFNLIIPFYNPSIKEVKRLFDSLTRQCISYDLLKVIAVDDNSDNIEEYQKYISDNYRSEGMDVEFVSTSTAVHCPGNTRRTGMDYIDDDAEWLCFCDQDDYFEDNAFSTILNYIKNANHKITGIMTTMGAYDEQKQEFVQMFKAKRAWLHGKWYNIPNFIKKYNVNFKKDLVTHEDVYFNSCVVAAIFKDGTEFDELDITTYRWVENPDSLTRRSREDRGYFLENFQDYIDSAVEPFWNDAKIEYNDKDFINQIMMTLLHCYFYYEAFSYYNGPTMIKDILNDIILLIRKMINELGYTLDYIVDYLYDNPLTYQLVAEDCELCTGKFICKTSLRDFIYKVGTMELRK